MNNDPLRVALFTYSTKPRGGVVHTLNLAETLSDLGHRTRVYALGRRDENSFYREVSVPTTIVPFTKRDDESFEQRVQRYIRRFNEYLAEEGPDEYDVYHSQDCISANALASLRGEGDIPHFVRTVHHVDDFKTESLIRCQNHSIHRPDRRVVVSSYWKKKLTEDYQVSATVIPNGVDLDRFEPASSPEHVESLKQDHGLENRTVFLTIGGVEPRKNSHVLLDAFQQIHARCASEDQPATWVIAGGKTLFDYRDYRQQFHEKLEESPLESGRDVRIMGPVSEQTILDLYQLADVLLFPSRKEGFGLVILEAMACELPVVASDIEVFQEYLNHGENALLVDPDDPGELAEAALRLRSEDALRRQLIQQGRSTAREFSWEETGRQHVEFYRRFLEQLDRLSRAVDHH